MTVNLHFKSTSGTFIGKLDPSQHVQRLHGFFLSHMTPKKHIFHMDAGVKGRMESVAPPDSRQPLLLPAWFSICVDLLHFRAQIPFFGCVKIKPCWQERTDEKRWCWACYRGNKTFGFNKEQHAKGLKGSNCSLAALFLFWNGKFASKKCCQWRFCILYSISISELLPQSRT